jgi:LysM repeat protein
MKLRLMMPKKKLRATAARRVAQPRELEEYDDEPTMKLSSAFIVVLLLHVVAVGGIYAFNSIKAHHSPSIDEIEAKASPAPVLQQDTDPQPIKTAATSAAVSSTARTADAATTNNGTKASVSTADVPHDLEAPAKPHLAKDSGLIHVVAKGENPVLIAKKLGVSYDDLLKLNNISDPKKLQIGQKLHVPVKNTAKNTLKNRQATTNSASANSSESGVTHVSYDIGS